MVGPLTSFVVGPFAVVAEVDPPARSMDTPSDRCLTPTTLALSASIRFGSEIAEFGRRLRSIGFPGQRRPQSRGFDIPERPLLSRTTRGMILESLRESDDSNRLRTR
ncbi:hypothetical protein [Catenuloplanes indicus]|uniref:Uncharacterized protein n=1 Tax=Catenuloplanes indicus TaxID=137267 RepID=A0AAE3VX05_9ACTN|nr:hypothetical protein [Catenuloplanes indicus]MDQ0365558.1 hypothetical protein [Catenuloplanes indicus]